MKQKLKKMENEINYRFGTLRKLPDNIDETRTVEFVISDETRDRHGTILKVDRWKLDNFNSNGIVGYQHNVYGDNLCDAPNPDDVIGKGEAFIDGKDLIGRVTFEPPEINPLAEKIFQKVKFGTLRATSVGFIPFGKSEKVKTLMDDGGEIETKIYGGQELIEFSIVNIPSNPKALKKSLRNQTANALQYVHRMLDGEFSFKDIREMTVDEVIKLVNKDGLERDNEEQENNNKLEQQQIELNKINIEQEQAERQLSELKLKLSILGYKEEN